MCRWWPCFGSWYHVVVKYSDVRAELTASIFRVTELASEYMLQRQSKHIHSPSNGAVGSSETSDDLTTTRCRSPKKTIWSTTDVKSWENLYKLTDFYYLLNTLHSIRPTYHTYLLTNLRVLTYSMKQSHSWEANGFSASQEIPAFYWTRRFIIAFTSARHQSLSWASSIQSIPHNPLPEDPSSFYPLIYDWVFQVVSFPQVSAPKSC
jgi:hypothetical protein